MVVALVLASWIGRPVAADAQETAPGEITQSLFLIGDAGTPAPGGDPVLLALRRDLSRRPEQATVVFLGDNIYPAGLPPEGHPGRAQAEKRLHEQVDAVRDTGARVVFVPGNHDWDNAGADGWEAVKRQQARVVQRGGSKVAYMPEGGCPGPEVVDIGDRLRIVALDTQWWLHEHARPVHPSSVCPADSEEEVLASLREALRTELPREVVIVTHHPPLSGGPHGGKFSLRQHLFPLTERRRWLWLPLPGIGSLYPAARMAGITSQDISSEKYGRMRDRIASVLAERRPLAWAAGHEHILQVIEHDRFGRVLVSGAGAYAHGSHAEGVEGSRYQSARSGYLRLDFLADGRERLGVVEVGSDGGQREAWSAYLAGTRPAPIAAIRKDP
jgi:Calcineurin-like phosphoesterase